MLTFIILFHFLINCPTSLANIQTNFRPIRNTIKTDLIFSSAFLGFSRHSGFIAALEDFNCFEYDRIVGTSSGSLAGSFLAAGLSANQISRELSRQRPIELITPTINVRSGAFSLKGLISHLRTILPKDFNQLQTPLAGIILAIFFITTFTNTTAS